MNWKKCHQKVSVIIFKSMTQINLKSKLPYFSDHYQTDTWKDNVNVTPLPNSSIYLYSGSRDLAIDNTSEEKIVLFFSRLI